MLGLILPDAVYGEFVDLARSLPPWLGRVVIGMLVGGWLFTLALILRGMALWLDLRLALAARRRGAKPGEVGRAIGHIGLWLPRVSALIALLLVIAQLTVSFRMAGYLDQSGGMGGIAAAAGRFAVWMLPS